MLNLHFCQISMYIQQQPKPKNPALIEKSTLLSDHSFSRETEEAVPLPWVPAKAPCTHCHIQR